MKRRILGGTGMSVSEYALGTMMFGAMGNTDHDESVRMIHTALDAGINLVDTADVYSGGESEVIVGKALKGRRDDVVLATKFGLAMGEDPNRRGGSARWIRRALEEGLRRLDTDHVDLYQMHRPDPCTDIDETLAVLSDLVRAGKVRAVGGSFFFFSRGDRGGPVDGRAPGASPVPHRAAAVLDPHAGVESRVLPTAQRYGMGVLTFGPLNSGWLSGRSDPTGGHRSAGAGAKMFDLGLPGVRAKAEAVRALADVAAEAGLPLPHLATAFVLAHPAVTAVLIGPRRPEQLTDLLAAADVELGDDVLDRVDEIVPPGVDVNPGDFYIDPTPPITDKRLRRRWPPPSTVNSLAGSGRSADVDARSPLGIRFRAAQDLAGDRGDLAVAEDQEADQMADRVALGPGEIGVRDLAGAVAEGEEDGGDRVRDRGARDPQPSYAVLLLAVHGDVRREVRGVAQQDLQKQHRAAVRDMGLLALAVLLGAVLPAAVLLRLVRDQPQRPVLGRLVDEAGRGVVERDLGGAVRRRGAPASRTTSPGSAR